MGVEGNDLSCLAGDGKKLAIIGGSGLFELDGLQHAREIVVGDTDYGEPSAPIIAGTLGQRGIYFMARHGAGRHLPPHAVNYRANIAALALLGVTDIITVNIVGGIGAALAPGTWVVPDQLVDYTWGRRHTYYDGAGSHDGTGPETEHIDFDPPFSRSLAELLMASARHCGLPVGDSGTYGCTQGPRLETAAEIRRLARDGCDMVGMTAMPEAALARERGLHYAALCLVVNWAAGVSAVPVSVAEMSAVVASEMPRVLPLLAAAAARL